MPPSQPRRRGLFAVFAGAVLATTLVACSPGGGDAGESAGDDAGAVTDSGADGGAPASGALGAGGGVSEEASIDREIVTTAYATVVAPDPSAAARDLARLAEQAGGRVEQRSEVSATDDEPGSASLTLRIPADRISNTLEALSGIGEVRDVNVETVDVTGQGRDLDARIGALTTSTQRLRELMGSAGSTEDLLRVEQELSDRQAELDALKAQRQQLSEQVAMSTLRVDVTSQPVTAAVRQGGFVGCLESGWAALVTTVQGVVLVLGILLPWVAVAAVGYLVFRLVRGRVRPAAPGSPGGGSGPRPDEGPDDGGPSHGAPFEPERAPQPVGR
jgi:glycine cleavage system regulatory protein